MTTRRMRWWALVGFSEVGSRRWPTSSSAISTPIPGFVLLDGKDVRDISPTELRANVSLVDQAAFRLQHLDPGKRAIGVTHADEAAVTRAVERAGLGDFVVGLFDGLGPVVGEDGRRLPARERQRVAIAGALLADPGVLITHREEMLRGVDRVVEVGAGLT